MGWIMILGAQAASHEFSHCGRALSMAIQGDFSGNLRPDACPVTARLVDWLELQKSTEGPDIIFPKMIAFFRKNPDWPLKDRIQIRAEESLKGNEKFQDARKWFEENPPLTSKGKILYARALMEAGRKNAAQAVIRDAWINLDLEGLALKTFWNDFKICLAQEDHQKRVDRLLIQEKAAAARIMFPWLNKDYRALAEARIALIRQEGDVDAKLSKVPKDLAKDPGLIYDRIKWHRRKENNASMLALFAEIPQPKGSQDLWWKERNLLVRRLMDDHQYQDAYNLIKDHSLSRGENFAHGEWLAGWIALRMLKRPGIALGHFQKLYENVKSPISVARAAYWAARASAALGKKEETDVWLAKAKAYPGTYYGQVALRGSVTGETPPLHSKRPSIDGNLREKFEKREMVQAIQLLSAAGGKHLIEPLSMKLFEDLTNPGEQILLIELAAKELGPYYRVTASKKLPLKNVPLIEAAYPILPRYYHTETAKTNAALVHAIIRQESRFKPDAVSPAGAQGLMQLMPKTALETAQKTKTRLGSLWDANVNISLGCAHLRELLKRYKGSLILSIAAYNAGVAPVEEWIKKYGDPRQVSIDLVDWIEKIPFAETRNYVQRVLENYAYYAQRLGNNP